MLKTLSCLILCACGLLLWGCGGSTPAKIPSPTLSVSPGTSTLLPRATQTFTAALGSAPATVAWSIQEGSAGGEITATGIYTAPYTPGTYHLTAILPSNSTIKTTIAITVKVGIAGNGRYTLIDLGPRTGGSAAKAVNNRGQVLFTSELWDNGTRTPLEWQANAFNDNGMIVGEVSIAGAFGKGKTLATVMTDRQSPTIQLPTLGGLNGSATGVNNAGQVVGWASTFTSIDIDNHAGFVWQNGSLSGLGPGEATAINNAGQILISDSLRQLDGSVISLGVLPGSTSSRGIALNDTGQVTGVSFENDGTPHGFLWAGGTLTALGTLGGRSSSPRSINAAGLIVGNSALPDGRSHAFLYRSGQIQDLNTLTDGASGWEFTVAVGINTAGQIIGSGSFQGSTHDFLLNPQ